MVVSAHRTTCAVTLRRLALAALAALAGLLAGCEGCATEERPPTTCSLPDGTSLSVGQSGPAEDGCNICLCTARLELSCTLRDCSPPPPRDAGPGPVDGGSDEGDAGVIDEGPCRDADRDGFYDCIDENYPERPTEIDCDDTRFHVQPGGIEFPDTPEDDNCDGSNDDWQRCGCEGPATSAPALASAMDLCGDVVVSATKSGAAVQFGIVEAYQGVVDVRVRARQDEPDQAPVIIGNNCMATLSTGDAVGTAIGIEAGTCSGIERPICDVARLDLTLRAPPNARGFAFDFMFLSYEWPEFLCLVYNDTFLANVRTPAVNDGVETNAAFDTSGRPITVNVGFFENPAEWTVPLDGTSHARPSFYGCPSPGDDEFQPGCTLPSYCAGGLDAREGSGSGWLTTSVPIVPGQQDLRLTLRIHDEGDGDFDSIVLLDGFRWLPNEPELQTSKEAR
jgi:hypothetical protein